MNMSKHEEESSLLELEKELAAVSKQIGKVEMNAVAVEDAIAGHGTYRGYSGEDVFLRHNLRVVQREMIKQLRRKERDLMSRKRQVASRMGARSGGPSSSPGEPTISPEVVGGREGGDRGSSRTVNAALGAQGVVATPSASISAGMVVAGPSVSGGGTMSSSPETPQVAESPAEPPRPTNPDPLPVHAEPSPRATSPAAVVSVVLPSLEKPAATTRLSSDASANVSAAPAESTEPVQPLGAIPSASAGDSTGKTAGEQTPSGEPPEQQSVEPRRVVDLKRVAHPPQQEAADLQHQSVMPQQQQGTPQPQAVTPQLPPTTLQPRTVEEKQLVEPREKQASEPHEQSSGCQERAFESHPQSDNLEREPVSPEQQPAQPQEPAQPQLPVQPQQPVQPHQAVQPQQRTAQEGPADPEHTPIESQQQVVASQEVTDQQQKPVEQSEQPQRLVGQERPAVDKEKQQTVGQQQQTVGSQPEDVGLQREPLDQGHQQPLSQPPVSDSESVDQQQRPLASPQEDVGGSQQDPGEQDRSLPEESVVEQQQQAAESLPQPLPPSEASQQEQETVTQRQQPGNPARQPDTAQQPPAGPPQQPVEPEQQTPSQQRSGGDKHQPSRSRQQSDEPEPRVQGRVAAASDTAVQKQTPSKRPATTTPANQSSSKRPSPTTKSQLKASKQDSVDSAATGRRSSKSPASEQKNPRSSRKSVGKNSAEDPSGKNTNSKRNFIASPRVFKTPKRGSRHVPGPAHSVEEYLAGTQRGIQAVASIKEGTAFWIKFSDTKVAWLECGVIKKVHGKSAKPYEVEWRPYDCSGCEIAGNLQKRISLTPRLFVGHIEDQERLKSGEPPAGTEAQACSALVEKSFPLNVPPIGSWCLADPGQPWGALGPFAF